MMMLPSHAKVYLSQDAVDMRKSIHGLSIFVSQVLKCDPRSAALFVFLNRARNKVKILYWDRNGFALWYKSLARGRYRLPMLAKSVHPITFSDLSCLLEGIDLLDSQRLHAV